MTVWILVLWVACGEKEPADVEAFTVLSGTCDVNMDAAEVVNDVVVIAETDWLRFGNLAFEAGDVFGNEEAYLELQAEFSVALPDVDFSDRVVVGVWAPSDTCDVHVGEWTVVDLGNRSHVHAAFEDGSRCGTCSDPGGALLLLSIALRDELPSLCRAVTDVCSS